MLPVILTALKIASIIPSVAKLFGASDPTVEAATKVISMANSVTGVKNSEETIAILEGNLEKRMELDKEVNRNSEAILRLLTDDLSSARERDIRIREAGGKNHRANVMLGCVFLLICAGMAVAVFYSQMNEFAKTIVNLMIGRLLGYADQAFNFEFGISRREAGKDETISRMKEGEGK